MRCAVGIAQADDNEMAAAREAICSLFAEEGFPQEFAGEDLVWRRDPLGRPYVEWNGCIAAWAQDHGLSDRFLHVSNTHDGGEERVLAVYGECVAGVGVDAVWLPRLRLPGKDAGYLLRFARQFMSTEEHTAFLASVDGLEEEPLRQCVAAHFSLMEAASKACGTGLKIGAGMGRATSLPKQSLGALCLSPEVELYCGEEARARLEALDAAWYAASWQVESDFLLSKVLLLKALPPTELPVVWLSAREEIRPELATAGRCDGRWHFRPVTSV